MCTWLTYIIVLYLNVGHADFTSSRLLIDKNEWLHKLLLPCYLLNMICRQHVVFISNENLYTIQKWSTVQILQIEAKDLMGNITLNLALHISPNSKISYALCNHRQKKLLTFWTRPVIVTNRLLIWRTRSKLRVLIFEVSLSKAGCASFSSVVALLRK